MREGAAILLVIDVDNPQQFLVVNDRTGDEGPCLVVVTLLRVVGILQTVFDSNKLGSLWQRYIPIVYKKCCAVGL